MRVVFKFNLSLVLALMVGACADPPADPTPGGAHHDDRWVPAPSEPGRPRPVTAPDDGRWHLWVASPWSVDAVHDPWSPEALEAERWFFGPIVDVASTSKGIVVALEAGAIVSMDASLQVTAVQSPGLSHPRALAVGNEDVFVADADLGLFAFRSTEAGIGAPRAWADHRPHALVDTHVGLFAAVTTEAGDEVMRLDEDLSVSGRWHSAAWTHIEGLGYGPDGAIYVVDGGPCVYMHDNPEHIVGQVEPTRTFCRSGRAYHGVLPVEDGDGYLAHDEGIDVFAEVTTVEDHVEPRHVIEGPNWPAWKPRFLAHGWAH